MKRVVMCHSAAQSRANYLQSQVLPDNYMGDYTVMGLIVDRYDDAIAFLASFGYQLESKNGYSEVLIDSPKQLTVIKNILATEDIYCEHSDIADTLYQA